MSDATLDRITAGTPARIDLDLSASADGPTAATSTQGSVTIANTTVDRVEVDPTAPPPASVRLLGVSTAQVGFAKGEADASGASNAQCSANALAVGDSTYVTRTADFTEMAATCTCSAFVVGILSH